MPNPKKIFMFEQDKNVLSIVAIDGTFLSRGNTSSMKIFFGLLYYWIPAFAGMIESI